MPPAAGAGMRARSLPTAAIDSPSARVADPLTARSRTLTCAKLGQIKPRFCCRSATRQNDQHRRAVQWL